MGNPRNPYGARPGGGVSLPDYYRPMPSLNNRNAYFPGTELLPKGVNEDEKIPEGVYLTDYMCDLALEFMERSAKRKQPFFLYVTATAFHGPPHHKSYQQDIRYTQGGIRDDLQGLHPPRSEMRARLQKRGLPYNHDTVGISSSADNLLEDWSAGNEQRP